MDAPPPKRRRTSPRLAGHASSDGPDAAVVTGNHNDNNTDAAPVPRSKIPLFASPTRASLARHNPDILERRRPASRGPSVPPNDSGRDGDHDGAVRPLQQPAMRSPARNRRRSALSRSPSRGLSQSPTRRLGLFSEPPVHSPVRGQSHGGGGDDGSAEDGTLRTALPQRTPTKRPVPRPLPPPEPTRAEDVLEPLVEAARERQRRAAAASGGGLDLFRVQQEEPAEPELPPTPEHPDPALTTSPPGIHNVASSTPSKRPPRPRSGRAGGGAALPSGKATGPRSSSPLKQLPLQPAAHPGAAPAAVAKPAVSKPTAPQKKRPGKEASAVVATAETISTADNRGDGRVTRSAAVRGIKPADPDAAKKKERDALLAEIAELEADLVLAGTENERIRKATEDAAAAAGPAQRVQTGQPPPPGVREDLLALLRRRAPPIAAKGEDAAAAAADAAMASWLQGASNPIAFLPFGKPAGADSLSALLLGNLASAADGDDAAAAIASHRPISMTAAEELPYLQVFTPLMFSSQIVLLPSPAAAPASSTGLPPPLLQKHRITVASAHPHSSLFRARIEMTVNAKSLRVTDLRVPRIEPLAAADELQPLLMRCGVSGVSGVSGVDGTSSSSSNNSALLRNVTILTWAMGEWVRVAVRRARFWVALERRLQDKSGRGEAGAGAVVLAAVAGCRPRTRKRKRRQARAARRPPGVKPNEENDGDDAADDEDDDNGDDSDDSEDEDDNLVVSEAELLANAGRTAMDVDVPFEEPLSNSGGGGGGGGGGRGLRVEWTIQFDWTGEARSAIGLLVGVPGQWRKADDRGRLAALPRLFNQLVHGNTDPTTAVETVVALLAERR